MTASRLHTNLRGSLAIVVAACGADGDAIQDAPPQVVNDATPDARACLNWTAPATHFDPCRIPLPMGALELGSGIYTYETRDGILTRPDGTEIPHANAIIFQEDPAVPPPAPDARPGTTNSDYRVVSVTSLHISSGARLDAIGIRPLVIVAWDDIEIDGVLDASSRLGVQEGAGFRPGCGAGSLHAYPQTAGYSGGGGGGGFQAVGGAGGTALNGARPGGPVGTSEAPPLRVLGGCDGGIGGFIISPTTIWADGGRGGGAVQLTARRRISVAGQVLANGSGGEGGPSAPASGGGGGGGGGGSGGHVGLEAPEIVVVGRLAANGGGGGEGASVGVSGHHGEDGRFDGMNAAGGDLFTACGTAGGAGGATFVAAGADVTVMDGCAGGGGGGGVGYIVLRGPSIDVAGATSISPAATVNP